MFNFSLAASYKPLNWGTGNLLVCGTTLNHTSQGLFLYYSRAILSSYVLSIISTFLLLDFDPSNTFFFSCLYNFFPIRKKLPLTSPVEEKRMKCPHCYSFLPPATSFSSFLNKIFQSTFSVSILSSHILSSFLVIPLAKSVGFFSILPWWTSIWHIK